MYSFVGGQPLEISLEFYNDYKEIWMKLVGFASCQDSVLSSKPEKYKKN